LAKVARCRLAADSRDHSDRCFSCNSKSVEYL
jgi:hypothetical protein